MYAYLFFKIQCEYLKFIAKKETLWESVCLYTMYGSHDLKFKWNRIQMSSVTTMNVNIYTYATFIISFML